MMSTDLPLCAVPAQDMAGTQNLIPRCHAGSQAPEGQTHSCVSERPVTSLAPQGEGTEGTPVARHPGVVGPVLPVAPSGRVSTGCRLCCLPK